MWGGNLMQGKLIASYGGSFLRWMICNAPEP